MTSNTSAKTGRYIPAAKVKKFMRAWFDYLRSKQALRDVLDEESTGRKLT